MTKSILFLLLFLSSTLFAQETIQVKNKKAGEVYSVLKSDKKTKHGKYQKFNSEKVIITEGYYKNGKKDSLWIQYAVNGNNLLTKGNYLLDEKVGVREIYDERGELEQKYDHTKNEVIYSKCEPDIGHTRIFQNNDTIIGTLDCLPIYKGGISVLYRSMMKIVYPENAREEGIQGIVYINFTIDSLGRTCNHYVLKGVEKELDEEALRVVKLIPDNWIPGVYEGRLVNSEYCIPINFRIQ